jgi:hypothetical protein
LGETTIRKEEFDNFLKQQADGEFSKSKYSVFDNNCICFSEKCSQFLIGDSIPNEYRQFVSNMINGGVNTTVLVYKTAKFVLGS